MSNPVQNADVVVRVAASAIHVVTGSRGEWHARAVPVPAGMTAAFGGATPSSLDQNHRTPTEIVCAALSEAIDCSLAGKAVLVVLPDEWGRYRRQLITEFLERAGGRVRTCSETHFALAGTASDSTSTAAEAHRPVLLLRVGSATTSATLATMAGERWTLSQRVETEWGGDDLDDGLLRFVADRLPPGDGVTTQLRTACTAARELLTTAVHADVTDARGTVRIHRADLDEIARPCAEEALRATLQTVLRRFPDEPAHIWVTGGAAATPLVAQLTSELADRPVRVVDWASQAAAVLPASPAAPVSGTTPVPTPRPLPTPPLTDVAAPAAPPRPVRHSRRSDTRRRAAALVAAGVVLAAFGTAAALSGGANSMLNMIVGEVDPAPQVSGNGLPPAAAATRPPVSVGGQPAGVEDAVPAPAPGAPDMRTDRVTRDSADPAPGQPTASDGAPAQPADQGEAAPAREPRAEEPIRPPAAAPVPERAPAPAPTSRPPAPAPSATTSRPAPAPTTRPPEPSTAPAPTSSAPPPPPVTTEPPAPPRQDPTPPPAAPTEADEPDAVRTDPAPKPPAGDTTP
ncbi:hypothetical protein [Granulicoccus sp. GXG6511]|uniref:cell division protein FtsA n=1 Tax=Granulicoccus sp. GXG6511 TaxID=3381351 RepID=UPI003D7EBEA3